LGAVVRVRLVGWAPANHEAWLKLYERCCAAADKLAAEKKEQGDGQKVRVREAGHEEEEPPLFDVPG
jgi:hypothetical protein